MSDPIKFGDIVFRGKKVQVTEASAAVLSKQDPKKFYYGMRHGELDWGQPITVEPFVLCNRWGVMITEEPFDFPNEKDKYLNLTEEEQEIVSQGTYIMLKKQALKKWGS